MRRCILLLCFAALLTGCSDPGVPRVGVVMSIQPARAAEIAADDYGESAGPHMAVDIRVSGKPVAADTALLIAQDFASDPGIIAVIGHANSAASLAASQVYNRAGLVQIAPTTTATVYSNAGPYSYRMVPGDEHQARFIAQLLQRDGAAGAATAVVYVNDDYGRSLFRELRPLLDSVAYEGVYTEEVNGDDLISLAAQIGAAAPELLIWIGRPAELLRVLTVLRRTLSGLHVLCGDACDSAVVHENRDGGFTGVRFVRFIDPAASTRGLDSFRRRYTERTGEAATGEAVLTYDAVLVVAEAIRSGARSREEVRQFLDSLGRGREPVSGLAGPIQFDGQGNLLRGYLLAEVAEQGVRPASVSVR